MQNQNLRCEFHQGAPGHTLDTCWRLRDKIQEMIDTRQISFNEAKPLNVRANPLPDHGSGPGPSVNMIIIVAIEEEEDSQETSIPFVINYALAEVAFASVPFVIEVPAKEAYQDSRVPWTYESEVASAELDMSAMGITRSGRVYQGSEPIDKGKAPATGFITVPEVVPLPTKKVTDQEAETFMKVIKASKYKVVEQMSKSSAHISLLSLLLSSEPHRDTLLKVLTAAQVPKKTTPERMEETMSSIFLNQISFSEDEIPSEGQGHLRALHIVCKCNITSLMNVDTSRIRASKTTVRAFDGSRRDIMGGTSDSLITESNDCSSDAAEAFLALPAIYAVTEETSSKVHICPVREDEELPNWTSVPLYLAIVADVLQSNPNHGCNDSNSSETHLGMSLPIYFGEGLDEDGRMPEIEESLHRLENNQLTSVEPTEDVNIGNAEESRTLRIGTGLDPAQRARMIDFLTEYQEVFAWSYADMLSLDPSIVCNYSEWVANIVPVEKKNGKVRVCIDYRDLNKASLKDNFPLPHIDVLVDNTARHTQFSFMDGFSGYN
ncbi:hypothetical protein CRG98_012137 [Punica granatum]|uniref:Reverse transcriptase domain-containing protein n=1 Tax=Punica granatum TaxID=22663 RepID=A0A2I0KH63_PUNGR|nr:hypothetical protein CRG98_012137 [Punica granatum]